MHPSLTINHILGLNGSGKTSLLEAIFMIGRGRSFRSHRIGPVIKQGEPYLQVFAETISNGKPSRIGIRRHSKQTQVKIDGNPVTRLSDIALKTPVQILTPKSHEMLERGPEYRRRFIEWGVFHVEHSYRDLHKRFARILDQRNAELRAGGKLLSIWDNEFILAATELNNARTEYFTEFMVSFDEMKGIYGLDDLELAWKPGWRTGIGLEEVLKQGCTGDKKMGFTHSGPHRADLDIVKGSDKAVNILSRGQQKMLVIVLNLVQATLVKKQSGQTPVILMDDLASELDFENRNIVLEQLETRGCQCFITTTDKESVFKGKVFHVEHGVITEAE